MTAMALTTALGAQTAIDFKTEILRSFLTDIHVTLTDNYAPERFSFDGIDRSTMFDHAKHAANLDWFCSEYASIFDAYRSFSDDESRALYLDVLRYKLAGHLHVRIETPVRAYAAARAAFERSFQERESALSISGMFGKLRHYDGVWDGARYTVDTFRGALVYPLLYRQYAFERNDVVIRPEAGDHVIDGGACTGDTSIVFSQFVGPAGRVYAFDPVQSHIDVCTVNFGRPGYSNIALFPTGLSDRRVEAEPVRIDTYSPGFRAGAADVPLMRIDDFVIDRNLSRIHFIKLDIEGSELRALSGAIATIRRFKPKLALSIYHEPNDFFAIFRFIEDLDLGYRFYLSHYTIWDEETVLYAIA